MFFYNIKSEQRSPTPTSDCLYPQLFVGGLMSYLCFYVCFLIVVPTISFGVGSVLLFFLTFRIPLCFICLFLFVCLFLSLSVFSLIFVLFSLSLSCVLNVASVSLNCSFLISLWFSLKLVTICPHVVDLTSMCY